MGGILLHTTGFPEKIRFLGKPRLEKQMGMTFQKWEKKMKPIVTGAEFSVEMTNICNFSLATEASLWWGIWALQAAWCIKNVSKKEDRKKSKGSVNGRQKKSWKAAVTTCIDFHMSVYIQGSLGQGKQHTGRFVVNYAEGNRLLKNIGILYHYLKCTQSFTRAVVASQRSPLHPFQKTEVNSALICKDRCT